MVEQGHQPKSSCHMLLPLDSPELQVLSRHFPGVGVGVGVGWTGAHGGRGGAVCFMGQSSRKMQGGAGLTPRWQEVETPGVCSLPCRVDSGSPAWALGTPLKRQEATQTPPPPQ